MNIVIVGAGPAGLSAAVAAAACGPSVTLIDDNASLGGQIWRGKPGTWPQTLAREQVKFLSSTRVISAGRSRLLCERADEGTEIPFDKLILATGSRELYLPFPGWTLPGVMGAGGLQALVKSGLPVEGKRIVVAGTGPLLLAVAAYLRSKGARICIVAEQAPWSNLLPFAARLPLRKHGEALKLWRPAYSPGTWVTEAEGQNKLEQVTLRSNSTAWKAKCDYLAIGYGLVPNDELAIALGSAGHIYLAGEINGIGGVDLAKTEGLIAGYTAAGRPELARKHLPARDRGRRFAQRLAAAFCLRPELRSLATPETLLCRCEDVPFSRVQHFTSWREAKLQTRCGMGPCQGRVCGPAARFLFGWTPGAPSTPLFPSRVSSLIQPAFPRYDDNDMTTTMQWFGVMPAITTPFREDLSIDHDFLAHHCRWLVDQGCTGLVPLGSLGEGATLSFEEQKQVLQTCRAAVGDRVPIVAGVSALATTDAVAMARMAEAQGCRGLMVLPPYVYVGDWREMQAHVCAIIRSTPLSCMLYNNPPAYKTDFLPEHVCELLAAHPNLHAIKESSVDVRRISALRALAGDRLQIGCGVDDLIVEAIGAGAVCWIAGLVNAFPAESVRLFDLAMNGENGRAFALYRWFLPLLRMDTVPKFVQLIKLVQQEAGMGSERVRPPRLTLTGPERAAALTTLSTARNTRTQDDSAPPGKGGNVP